MKDHEATEIWKPIQGYYGVYSVSTFGRVRREHGYRIGGCCGIVQVKEKILKPINNKGYLCVGLSFCGKLKIKQVHRLVAEAFIPNPDNLPQVNHKDENKQNNSVVNLEWCTQKYNINYGHRNENISKSRQRAICKKQLAEAVEKTKRKIMCVDTGKVFNSISDAEKSMGINHRNISSACSGKRERAGGYKWIYIK